MSEERGSVPLWLQEAHFRQFHSEELKARREARVIIVGKIGGGISGVSVAYWLTKNGVKDIVLLEARNISEGATGRNGGQIWPSQKVPSVEFLERYGHPEATKVMQFDQTNLQLVQEYLASGKHSFDTQFRLTGAVDLIPQREGQETATIDLDFLRYDYDHLLEASLNGFELFWWDTFECREHLGESTRFLGGIGQHLAGQLWPSRLVWNILTSTLALGSLSVHTQTKVTSVTQKNAAETKKYIVEYESEDGIGRIECKYVVYATNAWTPLIVHQLKDVIVPVRGQVLVTSRIKKELVRGNLSLATHLERKDVEGEGELYFMSRRLDDGRVVVGCSSRKDEEGGERVLTDEMYDDGRVDPKLTKRIVRFLTEYFPEMKKLKEEGKWSVEKVWCGIMGFTRDGYPLIGPKSKQSGEYFICGFNGDGMARCFAGGKAIAEMITGQLDPEQFVQSFLPTRFKELTS